jgi:hypothetical protein
VDLASGTETLWNNIYAGSTAGKISPNGKYLYINAGARYDITQGLPSSSNTATGSGGGPRQWFSQDGSRLFSDSGKAFRLSDIASQDLQYAGTLAPGGLAAVADSAVQQVTATVATGPAADTTIEFFGQQYLAVIGSISIPKIASGASSYTAHGRYLFWNASGNRLFAVIQADQTSGLLNDYAIYTVSLNGGCNTSIDNSNVYASESGGNFSLNVTASAGCAWKATSSASWLTISANALSAGSATVSYVVDPNPTTSFRSATITVDGQTLTFNEAAGTAVQPSALTTLPFRVADAEYSGALDRIVAISGSPSRLNIYNPSTGINTSVALPLPGNAVAVQPSGLRAAVCHDGLVSIANLQTATVEKTLNVSVNCYDIVFADNGYVYMSTTGGWGASSSVDTSTGVETIAQLLYNGINFRLNAPGDAVYTSNTGTSAVSVTRYAIAGGPMTEDYQSDWYPDHAFGYKIWFTHDGRMAADSGSVFRTGSTRATDFIYTGTLSGFAGIGSIGTLDHSTTRHLFASVGASNTYQATPDSDTSLFLHGDKYLALSSKMTLPKITTGGVSATSHGKFVFWDSAGAKAYVILQADASAGFLNDFAVYTLSPAFTPGCTVTLGINSATAIAFADTGSVAVNAAADCIWDVKSNASWIQIDTGTLGVGIGNVGYSVLANGTAVPRTGTITIGTQTFTVTQAAAQALRFVPVTPCRVADTRGGATMAANSTRSFAVPQGGCGIPNTALAYSLNVTVVPQGPLAYLTLWPTGQGQPFVSTLNSLGGDVVANAAIVPAGTGGAVSVYVTGTTDVILDINGYFDASATSGLSFFTATPCRVADTRLATDTFGGPSLPGGMARDFPVPLSACDIPATAGGYSLNVTVVPPGYLGYLTAWPTGQARPNASTLNSWKGKIVANAAIVPAGDNESISVYVRNTTDVILDINGYFGQPGQSGALSFYPVPPCRIADTRQASGPFGGPELGARSTRSFTIPESVCNIPATAAAYSLNVTVVPDGVLSYLSAWPTGSSRPLVSTLNSFDGSVVANAAIVPAGADGAVSIYVTNQTHVILDINGYFAP